MLITPPLKWPISPACAGNAMVIAAMRLRRRFIPLSRTLTCSFLFIEFQLLPRKGRREMRLLQTDLNAISTNIGFAASAPSSLLAGRRRPPHPPPSAAGGQAEQRHQQQPLLSTSSRRSRLVLEAAALGRLLGYGHTGFALHAETG